MRRSRLKRGDFLAAVLVLGASSALAQDAGEPAPDSDCLLNADVVAAPLKTKLPNNIKLLESKAGRRVFTQRLQLADGAIVTVSIGGCAHLAFDVRIERADLGANLRKGVEAVTSTLRGLPLNKYPMGIASQLLEALGKAKVSKSPAELPCGDGVCRFELTLGQALISYDFAL